MIVKYFDNDYNLIENIFDDSKINNLYNHLLSRKQNIQQQNYKVNVDLKTNIQYLCKTIHQLKCYPNFYKLWIYDYFDNFIATIDYNQQKEIIYYHPEKLKTKDNFNLLSYNEIIIYWLLKNWGTFGHNYYIKYGELPLQKENDIKIAQQLINKFESLYKKYKFSYNYNDEIFEPLLNISKNVIDNLFGTVFKPLEKETIVYRSFGLYSGKERSKIYNGWVSVTTNKEYVENCNVGFFEPFILPKGFYIINTNNLCDPGELIVRNEDLIKF